MSLATQSLGLYRTVNCLRNHLCSNSKISLTLALTQASRRKSTTSKQQWLSRIQKDEFIKKRIEQGYRCRSAFKLIEIVDQFHLFGRTLKGRSKVRITAGKSNTADTLKTLDLGCAPGGWSQVASKYSIVTGIDIMDMEPLPNVNFYNQDVQTMNFDMNFDVIISDMAHKFSGHASIDVPRVLELCELGLGVCEKVLVTRGHFVCKFIEGEGVKEFEERLQKTFDRVVRFKPKACRMESKERYFVCLGYNPP